jgi:transposase
MDLVVERCAGLDVHKDLVVACVRFPGPDGNRQTEIASFSTFTAELLGLRDWLCSFGVTRVSMEATGVYWKPIVRHEAPSNREEVQGLLRRTVAAVR